MRIVLRFTHGKRKVDTEQFMAYAYETAPSPLLAGYFVGVVGGIPPVSFRLCGNTEKRGYHLRTIRCRSSTTALHNTRPD